MPSKSSRQKLPETQIEPLRIRSKEDFDSICSSLVDADPVFKKIHEEYDLPPFWTRENSFQILVLIILEQQVSLASAYAAYKKLLTILDPVTPEDFLKLSDDELRAASFTRQKIKYSRGLAEAIVNQQINLEKLEKEEDHIVRSSLIALKGIGNWTIDIYLLHSLRRTDIFPLGDLALVNSIRMVFENPTMTKEEMEIVSDKWKPYRSVATMYFWHYYIRKKNIKLLH